jgi:2-amino-4-hydroxy-6-hydroxymethyldihydropteridine diphosphokinase
MNRAAIGVGSNIEPGHNIGRAKDLLSLDHRFLKQSSFVATSPIGFSDQPDFLNGAFLIETEMGLDEFQSYLKTLEGKLGRIRSENKNGPRTIDLDIIAWNGEVINNDYNERGFVKTAVNEVLEEASGQL